MTTLRAHFDGKVFVPDEPADFEVGRTARVLVDPAPAAKGRPPGRSLRGATKGMFVMRDDFNDELDVFAEYRR